MAVKVFLTLCATIVALTAGGVFGSANQSPRYALPGNPTRHAARVEPAGARWQSHSTTRLAHPHSAHAAGS
jgi:hypothetical protein